MTPELLIVGTGALATLFAARLAAAGVDVTMLGTWREGLEALRYGGVRLDGSESQRVRVTDNPAYCRGAKLALVLVKSWQTQRAAGQLVECLAEEGLAVTLQNGLGNDVALSALLGLKRVSRGVITIGATLLGPGIVRLGGEGVVTLEASPSIGTFVEMLRVANFDTNIVRDLQSIVWGKLIVNAAINPLTALLRVKNGDLLATLSARSLMRELACEAAAVANALGVVLPFASSEQAVTDVADKTANNISSMLQDVLRGAPTEVDAINGAIIYEGELMNISTPINRAILSLVKALPSNGKILFGLSVGGI